MAYVYPKIPLTELIEDERHEKQIARIKEEIDARDYAEPKKYLEKVDEVRLQTIQTKKEMEELEELAEKQEEKNRVAEIAATQQE